MEYEGEAKKTSVLFEKIWEILEAGWATSRKF